MTLPTQSSPTASTPENGWPDERVRAAWKVKAIPYDGGPDIPCVVQEVTAGGARLSHPRDASLPDQFSLYLPLKDETHRVAVTWRDDETAEAGVAFLDARDASVGSEQAASDFKIAQLQAHIQHLEEQLHRVENRVSTLMERVTRLEER